MVKDLFVSIWENIKGVVLGFVEWLSPVIDAIIAPFRAIGNVIGGIVGAVKGWMGETVDKGNAKLAEMSAAKAAAKPAEAASPVKPSDMGAIAAPSFGAVAAPAMMTTATTTAGAGNNSLISEHMAAASRKGVAVSDISHAASDAFMGAGAMAVDFDGLAEAAHVNFNEAMPRQSAALTMPWNKPEARKEKKERPSFNIQNLTLQSDDIKNMFDLYCQLEMVFSRPEAAAV
jgi:hypothetical protein